MKDLDEKILVAIDNARSTMSGAIEELYSLAKELECGDGEWIREDLGFADTAAKEIARKVEFELNSLGEKRVEEISNRKVAGYLLEFRVNGEWTPYEFAAIVETNIWDRYHDGASADWFKKEMDWNIYAELEKMGHVNLSESDDWEFRLGVGFDARTTPKEDPHECGIWGGEPNENAAGGFKVGDLWRVSKKVIDGTLTEKAKDFFKKHPDITWETKESF